MIKYVDALQARRELGALMDRARYCNEYTIIKRANKPVAAIVSVELLEGINRYSQELSDGILASARKNNMDNEAAMKLADEAKRFARKQ